MKAIVGPFILAALLSSANLSAQGTVFKVCRDQNQMGLGPAGVSFASFQLLPSTQNCTIVYPNLPSPLVMYLADQFYIDAGDNKVRAEIAAGLESEVKRQLTPAIEAKLDSAVTKHLAELTKQEAVTRLTKSYEAKINALEAAVLALQTRLDKAQVPGAQ